MRIILVDEDNFPDAKEIYTASWQGTHQHICTLDYLRNRDYDGYLRKKLGHLYMAYEDFPVGIFCLDGETLSDLYIHPDYQRKGYGKACVAYVAARCKHLRLTVLSDNARAIELYERMGFRFTGREIPLKNGLYEREMCLESINCEIIQPSRRGHDPALQGGLE